MKIYLDHENVFEEDEIEFDKKINFVFGKNGTGKSTIAKLIEEQEEKHGYEPKVFQGFEKIVDGNARLNAVVLGEENVSINQKIEIAEKEITTFESKIKEVKKETEKPTDGSKNLFTQHEEAKKNVKKSEEDMDDFRKGSAKKIKEEMTPAITNSGGLYDKSDFFNEISKAQLLQDVDIKMYKEILRSEVKEAEPVTFPTFDFAHYITEVNGILMNKVGEEVLIARFEDKKKREFAESGLQCHKEGDVCSFCGNQIKDEVFSELKRYFSADEVNAFKEKITKYVADLQKALLELDGIVVKPENFYSHLSTEVETIKNESKELLKKYRNSIDDLIKALNEKRGNLFEETKALELEFPPSFESIQGEYNKLVKKNNEEDLGEKQKEARDKLRFHRIKELCNEYGYDREKEKLKQLKDQEANASQALDAKKAEIEGEDGYDAKIKQISKYISDLRSKTENEEIMVTRINEKLENLSSFKLERCEKEGQGCYMVKCLSSEKTREITHLSTGEKNIIAFLYFIYKLEEGREKPHSPLKRVIVFDDPMNSNDDTMQYMIIEELQKLMKEVKNDEKMIILTHNNHFYLNVKYGRKYDKDKFIRLQSNGSKTNFVDIECKEKDFKTNYEALWRDVRYLYDNKDASPEMLFNPFRRIIETYTKFNMIEEAKFYEKHGKLKKLLNVNSHAVDDLEADLNGIDKEQIKSWVRDCFKENNREDHFDTLWGGK